MWGIGEVAPPDWPTWGWEPVRNGGARALLANCKVKNKGIWGVSETVTPWLAAIDLGTGQKPGFGKRNPALGFLSLLNAKARL